MLFPFRWLAGRRSNGHRINPSSWSAAAAGYLDGLPGNTGRRNRGLAELADRNCLRRCASLRRRGADYGCGGRCRRCTIGLKFRLNRENHYLVTMILALVRREGPFRFEDRVAHHATVRDLVIAVLGQFVSFHGVHRAELSVALAARVQLLVLRHVRYWNDIEDNSTMNEVIDSKILLFIQMVENIILYFTQNQGW